MAFPTNRSVLVSLLRTRVCVIAHARRRRYSSGALNNVANSRPIVPTQKSCRVFTQIRHLGLALQLLLPQGNDADGRRATVVEVLERKEEDNVDTFAWVCGCLDGDQPPT